MAKVIMPLMSMQVAGKLGDIVFYRRGDFGINCARMRVKPANPQTPKQQAVRDNLGGLTKLWKGETPQTLNKFGADGSITQITVTDAPDTSAWENFYIISSEGIRLKGRFAYISVNMKRLSENKNPIKSPDGTEHTLVA